MPALAFGQRAHDRLGGRRHRERHADAHHAERQRHPAVAGVDAAGAEHVEGAARRSRGRPRRRPSCRAASSASTDSFVARDQADRDREHPDAGLEGGVAHDRLQVGRQEVHDAHQREEHEPDRDARRAEAQVAEHAHVEHRVIGAALPGDEQREDRRADGEGSRGSSGWSSRARSASIRPHTIARETGDREACAREVERLRLRVARLRDQDRAGDQAADDDRDVDEEDAAPGEVLDQPAARDRPDRDAHPGHRRPDRDRLRALVLGEDVREDRERRRHDRRRADAHQGTRGDQLGRAARDGRQHASRRRRSTARPISAFLRPKRSPSVPAISSRTAKTSR